MYSSEDQTYVINISNNICIVLRIKHIININNNTCILTKIKHVININNNICIIIIIINIHFYRPSSQASEGQSSCQLYAVQSR